MAIYIYLFVQPDLTQCTKSNKDIDTSFMNKAITHGVRLLKKELATPCFFGILFLNDNKKAAKDQIDKKKQKIISLTPNQKKETQSTQGLYKHAATKTIKNSNAL